jgi:hypothetical protein
MDFEILGELSVVEIIAVNLSVRESADLKTRYGGRRWRKLKGIGTVRLASGSVRRAELHWYYPGTEEAHTNPTRQRGECLRALAGASG